MQRGYSQKTVRLRCVYYVGRKTNLGKTPPNSIVTHCDPQARPARQEVVETPPQGAVGQAKDRGQPGTHEDDFSVGKEFEERRQLRHER